MSSLNHIFSHKNYAYAISNKREVANTYVAKNNFEIFLLSNTGLFALFTLTICFSFAFLFTRLYNQQSSSNVTYANSIKSIIPNYFEFSKLKYSNVWHIKKYSENQSRTVSAKYQFIYTKIRSYKIPLSDAERITRAIISTSSKTGVDPLLISSIILAESRYNSKAVSSVGALGLMQLMPGTAKYIAKKIGAGVPTRSMLFTPEYNIRLGTAYFLYLSKMFQGDINKILVAYNWGPANVDYAFYRKQRSIPMVTRKYVSQIKSNLANWQKDFSNRKVAFEYAGLYGDKV